MIADKWDAGEIGCGELIRVSTNSQGILRVFPSLTVAVCSLP
jgi:hypothetical protein